MDTQSSIERVPIQRVTARWLHRDRVVIEVLRADLIDAQLSGNKYFKLLPNLTAARNAGSNVLLSFGGPWSNHLHALAAAGARYGFQTIGLVRGEPQSTACLADAVRWGMHVHFISRTAYRRRAEPGFLDPWLERYGKVWCIPEGGANLEGITGCRALLPTPTDHSHVMLACGTGATLAGLSTVSQRPLIGVQVLKGTGYLQAEVARLLQVHGLRAQCPWQVLDGFHGGGYGRWSPDLLGLMQRFEADSGIPLDPVYGAKLVSATAALVADGYFPSGAKVLLVHGGGLQGRRSLDASA